MQRVTMSTEIKTAITTACQSAVDVCKDGIVAVLPIGLHHGNHYGYQNGCRFFRSLANQYLIPAKAEFN